MNTKEHRVAALYYLHRFDHLKNVILEVWNGDQGVCGNSLFYKEP